MATFIGKIKFEAFTLTHSLQGECEGSIVNSGLSGGTGPYSVSWSGVNSYSATTFNIENLCPGTYKATVTDISGNTGTTTFGISGFTKPTLVASLTDDSCILDPIKFGTITVSSSKTETSSYNYKLYKDGRKIRTHFGTTANTTHTFTDLKNGMYTLSVVENRPTTTYTEADKTGCTSYDFNDGGDASGYTISKIYPKWQPFAPRAVRNITFPTTYGPNTTANGLGTQTIYFGSGLDSNGRIYSNNPYVWFYTGTTSDRLTDKSTSWYLGASGLTNSSGIMKEGNNVGPDYLVSSAATQVGKFYYNTNINKFLIWWYGVPGSTGYCWLTFDPRSDYGPGGTSTTTKVGGGNPITTDKVIGTTFGVDNKTVAVDDFTVSGASNTVIRYSTFTATAVNKFGAGVLANHNIADGLISRC